MAPPKPPTVKPPPPPPPARMTSAFTAINTINFNTNSNINNQVSTSAVVNSSSVSEASSATPFASSPLITAINAIGGHNSQSPPPQSINQLSPQMNRSELFGSIDKSASRNGATAAPPLPPHRTCPAPPPPQRQNSNVSNKIKCINWFLMFSFYGKF